MSPRAWRERIRDILDAVAEITAFTQGIAYDAFRNDAKTVRAVELDFIIIGEAANHIPEDVERAHPEVPWHLMRAMRNRLVHAYFSVDPQIVWDTIYHDLLPLVPLLEALVREPSC
jgi:uncharacterized protein with HEPN domain